MIPIEVPIKFVNPQIRRYAIIKVLRYQFVLQLGWAY